MKETPANEYDRNFGYIINLTEFRYDISSLDGMINPKILVFYVNLNNTNLCNTV